MKNSRKAYARMGRADRNWTKPGASPFSHDRVSLLVPELAQAPHYPKGWRSGWLSAPPLIPWDRVGATNVDLYITAAWAAGLGTLTTATA